MLDSVPHRATPGPADTRTPVRRPLTVIDCDGSPAAAHAVLAALARALDDGAPDSSGSSRWTAAVVLPVPARSAPGCVTVRARVLAALRPDQPADERTALVIATSGSTGWPKGVELSAAALRASAAATHERLGGAGRWLLALPVQHIAGVQVLVRSLLAGHEPAVLDLRGSFDTRGFAELASTMSGSRRYTALVPTQLVRLLDAGGAGLDALRGFDAVLVGGAACPPVLAERAKACGVAVVTTYGMTETAGGCVYDGRPLDGVRVRIGPDGRVELAGPTLALGYRLDPRATAAAFAGGWFRTDDQGRLSADGVLDVMGRLDEVIITGGHKVVPALVERALAAAPGVAQVCVVGLPDAEWGQQVAAAVVPSDSAAPPDAATLRSAARELAGPAAVPKLIHSLDALPRGGSGKIDRTAVRELLIGSVTRLGGC
jgi:o-succinylbenzoate---CoA ligase